MSAVADAPNGNEVVVLIGAGVIGQAITRRVAAWTSHATTRSTLTGAVGLDVLVGASIVPDLAGTACTRTAAGHPARDTQSGSASGSR